MWEQRTQRLRDNYICMFLHCNLFYRICDIFHFTRDLLYADDCNSAGVWRHGESKRFCD